MIQLDSIFILALVIMYIVVVSSAHFCPQVFQS